MPPPYAKRLDGLTPTLAARRLAGLPGLAWLDSAGGPATLTRYSYLSADPLDIIRWHNGDPGDPFDRVADALRPHRRERIAHAPPFQGGAVGLFGYGLGRAIERLPAPRTDEFALPDLHVGIYDWCLAFDHLESACWLFAESPQRIERVQTWLCDGTGEPRPLLPSPAIHPLRFVPLVAGVGSQCSRAEYEAAVARAVEYVRAGDCFQVNIAQRLLVPLREPPFALAERLRQRNPAPFAAYYHAGPFALVSASPERFVRLHAGTVTTRPIKGTRPRGATPEADAAMAAELLASPKDRAENVMIVDLLRNDLGRVCEFGSVQVREVCALESYRTVHHLVSEVTGQLRPGLGAADLLRASFPGGSVTGAPKVRAMQIINELEGVARGPYCGSLAWWGFDGGFDSSILIRTFTLAGGWCQFPAGGGIVADSDPGREYDETLDKARGMVGALVG